ncbi:MAG: EAL domain-containing protein [Firmicutes bacterium]|nr:EAL domain-containing protein [Bacillota bacterium]
MSNDNKKHTVLAIEDDDADRALLEEILSDKYTLIAVSTAREAFDALDDLGEKISVVLLNLAVKDVDGFEFLRIFRTRPESTLIPVIAASANADSEAEALRLGAYDFVHKPYDTEIVSLRVENVFLKSQYASLREVKAVYELDTLTGLYNKNKFIEETRRMLSRHGDRRFSVVRFDVNRFHLINAYFGLEFGDKVLIDIAKKLRTMLNDGFDICTYGRINKDIFIYCIPTADKAVIENTVKIMSDFLKGRSRLFKMQICCGIYIVEDNNMSVTSIYDKANIASKGCKDSYTNYFEYYSKSSDDKAKEEQEIVNDMEKAVANKEFEVWYQPKYDIIHNAPVGAEALVRWRHPMRGLIPPNKFIPVFENNGFITTLDFYVWDRACADLADWLAVGVEYPISINVSRVDLIETPVVDTLNELTAKYNIPHRLLNIEVTESVYTEKPQLLIDIVSRLKADGYFIYMDDFGSGYSSLSLLKDIDVNVLKIDMQFFEKGVLEKKSKNILASIIRMAKLLDMSVVAEGVETEEQVKFLKAWGCEYVQGYYFAKPMPRKDYEDYLERCAS